MRLDRLFKFSCQIHTIEESAQFPHRNQEESSVESMIATRAVWIDRVNLMRLEEQFNF